MTDHCERKELTLVVRKTDEDVAGLLLDSLSTEENLLFGDDVCGKFQVYHIVSHPEQVVKNLEVHWNSGETTCNLKVEKINPGTF